MKSRGVEHVHVPSDFFHGKENESYNTFSRNMLYQLFFSINLFKAYFINFCVITGISKPAEI